MSITWPCQLSVASTRRQVQEPPISTGELEAHRDDRAEGVPGPLLPVLILLLARQLDDHVVPSVQAPAASDAQQREAVSRSSSAVGSRNNGTSPSRPCIHARRCGCTGRCSRRAGRGPLARFGGRCVEQSRSPVGTVWYAACPYCEGSITTSRRSTSSRVASSASVGTNSAI